MFNFGTAIEKLKAGHKVARAGWNGKGMHLIHVDEPTWRRTEAAPIDPDRHITEPEVITRQIVSEPALAMFTAAGKYQIGWLASQADILAEDWDVVA